MAATLAGQPGDVAGTQLWLIRHGETEWSANGRHTGSTDLPLTETGREQATALRPLLAGTTFTEVLSSPLRRAQDTARLAGFSDLRTVEDLREWDYGDYEGLTSAAIHETRPDWTVFADGSPGGETAADVGKRADRVIDAVRAEAGPVLAFGHGHTMRVLVARWLDLPPEAGQLVVLDPATITTLGWEHGIPVLDRLNARG